MSCVQCKKEAQASHGSTDVSTQLHLFMMLGCAKIGAISCSPPKADLAQSRNESSSYDQLLCGRVI